MIVYNKLTGEIVADIPNNQNPFVFFYHYTDEFKENLSSIVTNYTPSDLKEYVVKNGELVKKELMSLDI